MAIVQIFIFLMAIIIAIEIFFSPDNNVLRNITFALLIASFVFLIATFLI